MSRLIKRNGLSGSLKLNFKLNSSLLKIFQIFHSIKSKKKDSLIITTTKKGYKCPNKEFRDCNRANLKQPQNFRLNLKYFKNVRV